MKITFKTTAITQMREKR